MFVCVISHSVVFVNMSYDSSDSKSFVEHTVAV